MNNKREFSNMLLYSVGSFLSYFGSAIYSFAIGLHVLKITQSGVSFATTLALGVIPVIILSPFAGAIVDRLDKKKIIVSMDIANGILFIGLFLWMKFFQFDLWIIYASTFFSNIFVTFFGISFEAVMPQLVSRNSLTKINSITKMAVAGSSVLAPMLGGLIFAFVNIELFVIINGISFLVSAVCESFIDYNYNSQASVKNKATGKKKIITDLKEGLNYIKGHPTLTGLIKIFITFNIIYSMGFLVILPYILNNYLEVSSQTYGLINSLGPIGMLGGALIVGKLVKTLPPRKLITILCGISAILIGCLSLPYLFSGIHNKVLSIVIFYGSTKLVAGALLTLFDVPLLTFLQSAIDQAYRGRVFGFLIAFIKAINPLAFIVAGLLVNYLNPLLLPAAVSILGIVLYYLNRKFLLEGDLEAAA